MNTSRKAAWIVSPSFDICLITGPAILISLLALSFAEQLKAMPPWLWLLLVVGVDAGHVYATLFRTYLVKAGSSRQQGLLALVPLLVWLTGCFFYSIDAGLFWRVLAYAAVFHFVRQQYGFMMIYARHDPKPGRAIDKGVIYAATLFPLIYWHTRGRSFNWFIEDDFVLFPTDWLWRIAAAMYTILIALYVFKEVGLWRKQRLFNLPRNLLLLGTALSWFVGIVAFDDDLVFSATNIVAHGIPYYALVWAYGFRQGKRNPENNPYLFHWLSGLFRLRYAPIYVLSLFVLAYWEEGLWDGLVWREHGGLFALFAGLPDLSASAALNWLVPLLSVPQATHYVLDALIWRFNGKEADWRQVLLR
jgi:hypothetical protein